MERKFYAKVIKDVSEQPPRKYPPPGNEKLPKCKLLHIDERPIPNVRVNYREDHPLKRFPRRFTPNAQPPRD